MRIQTPESHVHNAEKIVLGKQMSEFVDTRNMQTLGYRPAEDMDNGEMLTLDEDESEPNGGNGTYRDEVTPLDD